MALAGVTEVNFLFIFWTSMDSWMDKKNLHATAGLKYYPLNSFCFTWDPSLPGHVMHLLFSGELWTKKLFLGQKSSTTVNYWGKMHDYFTNWILQKKEGTKYFLLAKTQWANLAVTVNSMFSLYLHQALTSIVHVQVFLYYKYLLSLGDRRVESWPLMTSPFPTIALTLSYLLVRTSLYNPLFNRKGWL